MKKKIVYPVVAIIIYFVLIGLLLFFEHDAQGSMINSPGDAIWYSIVTLTTVGYGDVYPVTAAGKVISVVFIVCSIGLLATIISSLMSYISGRLLPIRLLKQRKNHIWNVFSEKNDEAEMFESNLPKDSVIIYLSEHSDRDLSLSHSKYILSSTVDSLVKLKSDTSGINFFCVGNDEADNISKATKASAIGIRSYCMATTPNNNDAITFFNKYECLSRLYWQQYPVTSPDEKIVIIGTGLYGEKILEQALINNVCAPEQSVVYDIYGDSCHFEKIHYRINDYFNKEGYDTVTFHSEEIPNQSVIENSSRIIIATDDDSDNMRIYSDISNYFVTGAHLFVRSESDKWDIDATVIGTLGSLLTPEYVMKESYNQAARAMNNIYNEGCENKTAWEDLSAFHKHSNMAAADHMAVKAAILLPGETVYPLTKSVFKRAYESYVSITSKDSSKLDYFRKIEHQRWVRFHILNNWCYSSVRDNNLKHHPMICPFENMSNTERKKDDFAWQILDKI